jgi:hypothetical protein
MDKKGNIRYIVVLFWDGVGYTYQTDGKVHWFFTHPAVAYKKLAYAKKRAEEVGRTWVSSKVCVFKVELDERLSCDQYDKWCEDENRLMFEFKFG